MFYYKNGSNYFSSNREVSELSTMAFQSLPLNTAAKNMVPAKSGTLVKVKWRRPADEAASPPPDLTQSGHQSLQSADSASPVWLRSASSSPKD